MAAAEQETLLVLASTFPASETDPVPAFVRDQIVALVDTSPRPLRVLVLAPHDARSETADFTRHSHYDEYRFHYARPRRLERLAGRGIMPALRENKLLYAVIPLLFWGEYRAALRLALRERPTLLYAHWFTPQAIVAHWVSRRTGIPFVFTTHASDVEVWKKVPWLGPRLVRRTASHARAMTAVSRRSAAKLTQFLAPEDAARVETIPMGVHLVQPVGGDRARARAELEIAEELVFLFIGRLVEKKGVEGLLRALKAVADRLPDWRLIVAGDGPDGPLLKELAGELDLDDRVEFIGYTTGDAKHSLFAAADVFLVPSVVASDGDSEGLPVALLEGLAYGLCSVATNESGADDIIQDGVEGILCSQTVPASLESALMRAVELGPEGRRRLGDAGRLVAGSFAWDVIAGRHRQVLFPDSIVDGD